MHRHILTAGLFFLATATAATAASLDPAHLPQDAKWVIHFDYEALSDTALMEKFRENRPQLVKHLRQWLEQRYGLDPQEDLQGVTLFSDTYESHTGAVILFADYDQEKVKSDVMSKPGVKMTEWQGHTLYTWTVEKHAHEEGRYGAQDDARTAERQRRDREQREETSITAVLLDGKKTIFAPTPERAQAVVKLLEGDAPTLEGEDSKLIADVPDGAIVYGAAVDLKDIKRHDRMFPILQQHEHIRWIVGERDDRLFEDLTLAAQNEDVATQMKTALEGFVALGKVWAAESENLAKLYENVEINRDGSTVHLNWQGDMQDVIAALPDIRERIAGWRGGERMRR